MPEPCAACGHLRHSEEESSTRLQRAAELLVAITQLLGELAALSGPRAESEREVYSATFRDLLSQADKVRVVN